jgi:hypothetical protein
MQCINLVFNFKQCASVQMTCFRNTRRTKTDISNFSAQQQDASSYILDFPRGTAVALPSIQVDEAENEEIDRKQCE